MKNKLFLLRSLSNRLTLSSLLVLLVAVWALAYFVSSTTHEDMRNALNQQQFSSVSVLAAEIEHEVAFRLKSIEVSAANITPAMLNDPTQLQAYLDTLFVLNVIFNSGAFITDVNGNAVASIPSTIKRIGVNYSDRDHFIGAINGSATISKPAIGKVLGSPVFVMSTPIRNGQGKVIGILAGVTNLAKPNFLDLITTHSFGRTGGYVLISPRHKQIVTATDKRLALQEMVSSDPVMDRFMQGGEGSGVFVNHLGVETLASVKKIPSAGWFLMAGLPTEEAFAPIRQMQRRTLFATFLLSLLASGLIFWIIQRQLKPMLEVTKILGNLSIESEFPLALPVVKNDELGALIGGFNRLLQKLTQREDTLRLSEENLAITLQSIGDGVIATDAAGNITRMNSTAERLTACLLSDALGRPLAEVFRVIDSETRVVCANPVQLVMEHGKVVALANRTALLARDGQEYQISDSAAPICDASGQIVGVVLVFSDVTAQYKVQEELQRANAMLRKTGELAKVGGWELDLRNSKLSWTLETFHIVEIAPPHELALDQGINLFAKSAQPVISAAIQTTMETGQPYDLELPIITAKGTHKWVRTQGFAVFEEAKVIKLHGTFQDITTRKEAEFTLAETFAEAQRFRKALDHVQACIYMKDTQSRYVYANRATLTLFNCTLDELRGAEDRRFFPSETADRLREIDNRVLLGQQTKEEIEVFSSIDERKVYLEIKSPIYTEFDAENVWGLVGISTDITVFKETEHALQIALKEKTSLLNEVHHRVKNNLQVITSLLRLEAGRSDQSNTIAVLNDMQGRIRSMALLHETLYRSGIFASADLAHYLRELGIQAFRAHAGSAAIELKLDLDVAKVSMDQATPCGLLVNELISNCLKHGFPDGRVGEIRLALKLVPGTNQALLSVSDNGVGLPADFEMKRKTSLGLQLASDLAKQIGGALDVGPGALFSVVFPLHSA